MVGIQEVRSELASLKRLGPGLVAVFVGGTNGIGEATAREFVRNTLQPRIYLVGRNQEQADLIKADFQKLNPESQTKFIQGDVSLLRNVDKICDEIKSSEEKINLLVLSAGILSMKGRDETPEGLDKKLSLHYYSRLRFAQNLLPLLNKAAEEPPSAGTSAPISRVFSVLGGGLEATLNKNDLSLKNTFSLSACANHGITMTTLSFNKLAASNPKITFVHTQPGGVQTNITRDMNPIIQAGVKGAMFLMKPWVQTAKESGERHSWAATVDKFGNGGVVLLGSKGDETVPPKVVQQSKGDGTEDVVWEHTLKVFNKICDSPDGSYDGK